MSNFWCAFTFSLNRNVMAIMTKVATLLAAAFD